MFLQQRTIKEFIFKTSQKHNCEFVSFWEDSKLDDAIKSICTQFNVEYKTIMPFHKPHSAFCVEPKFLYGKEYSARNFYGAVSRFSKYCTVFVCFRFGDTENKKLIKLIDDISKNNKKLLIVD